MFLLIPRIATGSPTELSLYGRKSIIRQKYLLCNIIETHQGAGILTSCPSAMPFGFTLGPTNPWLITIAKETLDFQWAGLSPALRLLRPTFSLPCAPQSVTLLLRCTKNASLPIFCPKAKNSMSSVLNFSPGNLWRKLSLTPPKAES